jgi:hypothetical protein
MTAPSDPTAALAEALHSVWPRHSEGTRSLPASGTDHTWTVLDPTLPSHALAAAILAALPAPWRLTAEPEAAHQRDVEALRMERHWPTPNSMRSAADALDHLVIPKYGDVLRWVADLADESLEQRAQPCLDTSTHGGNVPPAVQTCSYDCAASLGAMEAIARQMMVSLERVAPDELRHIVRRALQDMEVARRPLSEADR